MKDQVAVITGAASGLGLVITKKLAENGVKLALLDLSKDTPNELKNIVATGDDNSVELQLFTDAQDQLRGIKLWDYYK